MPETRDDGEGVLFAEQRPRIRQITGIRIHQLTLPESFAYASKLKPESHVLERNTDSRSVAGPSSPISPSSSIYTLIRGRDGGESSKGHLGTGLELRKTVSGQSRKERRISVSTVETATTSAHGASVPLSSPKLASSSPSQSRVARNSRARAPTLAGEALEQAQRVREGSEDRAKVKDSIAADSAPSQRRLARTFILLKIPAPTANQKTLGPTVPGPRRSNSDDTVPRTRLGNGNGSPNEQTSRNGINNLKGLDLRKTLQRNPSSTSVKSPPTTPTGLGPTSGLRNSPQAIRPSMGSPRNSGLTSPAGEKTRSRTTSLNSKRAEDSPTNPPRQRSGSSGAVTASRGVLQRTASNTGQSRRESSLRSPRLTIPETPTTTALVTPFFVSSIHHPSINPRFPSLTEDDFAPWLVTEEKASHVFDLELWYESKPDEWTRFDGLSKTVNLGQLRRVDHTATSLGDNTVLFQIGSDSKALYYLPDDTLKVESDPPSSPLNGSTPHTRSAVNGVVERSMRETRMKKGTGVGALHQLVNLQTVLADTRREIETIRGSIDEHLRADVDWRAMKRDISQRKARCMWIEGKSEEVDRTTREIRARVTLREQVLDGRQDALSQAQDWGSLQNASLSDLRDRLLDVETEREDLSNQIHYYRQLHVQTLDAIFPIQPLHPPLLLYTILDVPLPIPSGAKDPAPPLSLPPNTIPDGVLPPGLGKIDEKTTATALGYVAMVVQLLGNLGGTPGSNAGVGIGNGNSTLPYPITCAGSRSLVKDVVSLMQGPRSFPLYARGVERYRYEYAVFLLNKNIEMLMQESNIRLLDIRHTLPNLKMLLLTLSSPWPPATSSQSLSRTTTKIGSTFDMYKYGSASVTSSRQTSHTFTLSAPTGTGPGTPYTAPSSIGSVRASPQSDRGRAVSPLANASKGLSSPLAGKLLEVEKESPIKQQVPSRRSGLRRAVEVGVQASDDESDLSD